MNRQEAQERLHEIVTSFAKEYSLNMYSTDEAYGIMNNGVLLSSDFEVVNLREDPILEVERLPACHTLDVLLAMNELMGKWLTFLDSERISKVYTFTDEIMFALDSSNKWFAIGVFFTEYEYVDSLTHSHGWTSEKTEYSLLDEDDDGIEIERWFY